MLLGTGIIWVLFYLVLWKLQSNYARYPVLFKSCFSFFIFWVNEKKNFEVKLSLNVQYEYTNWLQIPSMASILSSSVIGGESLPSMFSHNSTQALTRPTVPGSQLTYCLLRCGFSNVLLISFWLCASLQILTWATHYTQFPLLVGHFC